MPTAIGTRSSTAHHPLPPPPSSLPASPSPQPTTATAPAREPLPAAHSEPKSTPNGSRHVRASSDPVSRGGAFSAGDLTHLLDQEPNPFEQSFSGPRHSSFPPEQTYDPSRPRAANANAVAGPSSSSSLPGVAAVRRARSISPSSNVPRATPSSGLGPIGKFPSLMGTPGGVNELVGSFRWDVDSLRSGPLSPALLTGPTSSSTSGAHSLFDPTTLRTGLTPLAPSGNISFPPPSPATAALFAMMTNNTPGTSDAAIVAGMSGGGSRPHEGVNEGNYFEASFARATDGGKGGMLAHAVRRASRDEALSNARGQPAMGHQLDFAGQHLQGPPTPLNALQRAALTSQRASIEGGRTIAPAQVMHPSTSLNASELGPPGVPGTTAYPVHRGGFPGLPGLPGHFSQQQHQQNHHYLAQQQQQHLQQQQGHHLHGQPGVPYLPNPAAGGNSNNPLYLLSQAQDMSSSHHDDAVGAAAALSNLSGPGHTEPGHVPKTEDVDMDSADSSSFGFNGIGTAKGKRGGPPPAPPAATNKRKKAEEEPVKKAPAKKGKRGKAVERDEDMDDFDDGKEDSMSPVASNPNETEEEKRKNFLERNRQAALKCRQRKKAWLANLQSKVEFLTQDNDTLQSTVQNLKDEISSLRSILSQHTTCSMGPGGDRRASQTMGMMGMQQQQQQQHQFAAANGGRY